MAQILVDVDDLLIGARKSIASEIRDYLVSKFEFGKWDYRKGDYLGRTIEQLPDRIVVHQQKYILENLQPISVAKGRRSNPTDDLTPAERKAFITGTYQLGWVSRETRAEGTGAASILSSKVNSPTVQDFKPRRIFKDRLMP